MTPRPSILDLPYPSVADAILTRQLNAPPRRCADSQYILGGQFMVGRCFSEGRADNLPALGNHILDIVFLGADKEVIRVDANAVIALVANEHSPCNVPHKCFVGESVREIAPASKANGPIARCIFAFMPMPASGGHFCNPRQDVFARVRGGALPTSRAPTRAKPRSGTSTKRAKRRPASLAEARRCYSFIANHDTFLPQPERAFQHQMRTATECGRKDFGGPR